MGTVTYLWFVDGVEVATGGDGSFTLVPNYFGDVVFVRAVLPTVSGRKSQLTVKKRGLLATTRHPL